MTKRRRTILSAIVFILAFTGSAVRAQGTVVTADTQAARPFAFALDAGVGYATHAGVWFGGLADGMNFQAGLRAAVDENNYLRLIFRQQDLGQQPEDIWLGGEIGEFSVMVEYTLREYQLLVGLLGREVPTGAVRTVGYLEYGISVMEHEVRLEAFGGSVENRNKLGLVLQGGVLALVHERAALDFSVGLTWKTSFFDDEAGGWLMGVHAGLALLF